MPPLKIKEPPAQQAVFLWCIQTPETPGNTVNFANYSVSRPIRTATVLQSSRRFRMYFLLVKKHYI